MSETVWAVDGSFFAQRLSGIQRYSIELLAALDRIVPPAIVLLQLLNLRSRGTA